MRVSLVVSLLVCATLAYQNVLPWVQCNFDSPDPSAFFCANVSVPLFWSGSSNQMITVHITRIATNASKADLWFNTGGPSHTGADSLVGFYGYAQAGFAVYLTEFRGLQWSTWLQCPNGTLPALDGVCKDALVQQWGVAGLQQFSLTNMALDVAYLMNATTYERPPRQISIYGVSFGTAVTNRLLQVMPASLRELVGSIVLDSVFAPHFGQFQEADLSYGDVGVRLFAACDVDAFCSSAFFSAFGMSSTDVLNEIWTNVPLGMGTAYNCLGQMGVAQELSSIKGALMRFGGAEGFYERTLAVATIFRIHRCNAADVTALSTTKDYFAPLDMQTIWPGDPLMANVFLSADMFKQDNALFTAMQFTEFAQWSRISNMSVWSLMIYKAWGSIPADQYSFKNGNYSMPTLLLSGELDPNTPMGWAAGMSARISATPNGKNVQQIIVPYANHVVLGTSPTIPSGTCGITMIQKFLGTNGALVDTSCLAHLQPLDFAAATAPMQALSQAIFGTTNMFGV